MKTKSIIHINHSSYASIFITTSRYSSSVKFTKLEFANGGIPHAFPSFSTVFSVDSTSLATPLPRTIEVVTSTIAVTITSQLHVLQMKEERDNIQKT